MTWGMPKVHASKETPEIAERRKAAYRRNPPKVVPTLHRSDVISKMDELEAAILGTDSIADYEEMWNTLRDWIESL